jgi:hypothetical protein
VFAAHQRDRDSFHTRLGAKRTDVVTASSKKSGATTREPSQLLVYQRLGRATVLPTTEAGTKGASEDPLETLLPSTAAVIKGVTRNPLDVPRRQVESTSATIHTKRKIDKHPLKTTIASR